MSSISKAFKRLQCLHLHFKDFNVFSHLCFQKTTMSSFTFQRLQCLQSFTLSKTTMSSFTFQRLQSLQSFTLSKTTMSSFTLQDFNVFCLLHLRRFQRLLSFIGLNFLVFVLLRTQRPLFL